METESLGGNAEESQNTAIPCATCGLGPEHHRGNPNPLDTSDASTTTVHFVELITVPEPCVICGLGQEQHQAHSVPDYEELATHFHSELEPDYDSESEAIYSESDSEDEIFDREHDFIEHPLNFAPVQSGPSPFTVKYEGPYPYIEFA